MRRVARADQRADAARRAWSVAASVDTGRFRRMTNTVIAAARSAASTMCTPTATRRQAVARLVEADGDLHQLDAEQRDRPAERRQAQAPRGDDAARA